MSQTPSFSTVLQSLRAFDGDRVTRHLVNLDLHDLWTFAHRNPHLVWEKGEEPPAEELDEGPIEDARQMVLTP